MNPKRRLGKIIHPLNNHLEMKLLTGMNVEQQ